MLGKLIVDVLYIKKWLQVSTKQPILHELVITFTTSVLAVAIPKLFLVMDRSVCSAKLGRIL